MGVVGCYSMDLYCDHPTHPYYSYDPPSITGETESECLRKAKKYGWRIDKNGESREGGNGYYHAICPDCLKKRT